VPGDKKKSRVWRKLTVKTRKKDRNVERFFKRYPSQTPKIKHLYQAIGRSGPELEMGRKKIGRLGQDFNVDLGDGRAQTLIKAGMKKKRFGTKKETGSRDGFGQKKRGEEKSVLQERESGRWNQERKKREVSNILIKTNNRNYEWSRKKSPKADPGCQGGGKGK